MVCEPSAEPEREKKSQQQPGLDSPWGANMMLVAVTTVWH